VRRTFDVRLIAAETTPRMASAGADTSAASAQEGRLGLRVEALPAQFVSRFQLSEAQQGVAVADVEEGGPSYGRIAPPDQGPDIILTVNDQRVKSPDDFTGPVNLGNDEEFTILELTERAKALLLRPFSPSNASQMLASLAERGMIYKNRFGKYSFAVPLLGRFILRTHEQSPDS